MRMIECSRTGPRAKIDVFLANTKHRDVPQQWLRCKVWKHCPSQEAVVVAMANEVAVWQGDRPHKGSGHSS